MGYTLPFHRVQAGGALSMRVPWCTLLAGEICGINFCITRQANT